MYCGFKITLLDVFTVSWWAIYFNFVTTEQINRWKCLRPRSKVGLILLENVKHRKTFFKVINQFYLLSSVWESKGLIVNRWHQFSFRSVKSTLLGITESVVVEFRSAVWTNWIYREINNLNTYEVVHFHCLCIIIILYVHIIIEKILTYFFCSSLLKFAMFYKLSDR